MTLYGILSHCNKYDIKEYRKVLVQDEVIGYVSHSLLADLVPYNGK